jgi:hypothetical protein
MEESGNESSHIHTNFSECFGDLKGMGDIGSARSTELAGMGGIGEHKGFTEKFFLIASERETMGLDDIIDRDICHRV